MKRIHQTRRGFTLIELLVVMSLIALLATLAIAFFPNAASSQVEARAAQQLQSWLTIAKQRALRDQAPRGVRLWYATGYYAGATLMSNVVTDCQYIEQPPDFPSSPGVTIMSGAPAGAGALYNNFNCVMFMTSPILPATPTGILLNGYLPLSAVQQEYWTVQPGDYLEVLGTGLMHQITKVGVPNGAGAVPPPPALNADYVSISPPLPYAITATANFRVVRAPRVTGDETLKMPDSTLIDLGTNTTYGNPLPPVNTADNTTNAANPGFIDILFSPSGEVISSGIANSNINLWVRSPNTDFPNDVFKGAPTIISVFTKTGFVGAYLPTLPPNPYALVR